MSFFFHSTSAGNVGSSVNLPSALNWDQQRFPLTITTDGNSFDSGLIPRDLVDPLIFTGPAYHVQGQTGDDGNTGLGSSVGDFSNSLRTVHAAITLGNANGTPFSVIVDSNELMQESNISQNGNVEPTQSCAIIGFGGQATYLAGRRGNDLSWSDIGNGVWQTTISSVKRVLREDVLDSNQLATDLEATNSLVNAQAAVGRYYHNNTTDELYINLGVGSSAPNTDFLIIRNFGAISYSTFTGDFYMENISILGGREACLELDAIANRNVVLNNCRYLYTGAANASSPVDAVSIRQTNGLIALFNCEASKGQKDGWNFHEDGNPGTHVLLQNTNAFSNGTDQNTSSNAFTTHDAVRSVVLNGEFGFTEYGNDFHMIQSAKTFIAGSTVTADDPDGISTCIKTSNDAVTWIQNATLSAVNGTENYALEVNGGGTIFKRSLTVLNGDEFILNGIGTISSF